MIAVADVLRAAVPGVSVEAGTATDMETIFVSREHIADVGRVLRDDAALQFALLVEVPAADYLPAEPRYEVIYHLACLGEAFATATPAAPARRLRVKVRVPGAEPSLPTVTTVWPGAGW